MKNSLKFVTFTLPFVLFTLLAISAAYGQRRDVPSRGVTAAPLEKFDDRLQAAPEAIQKEMSKALVPNSFGATAETTVRHAIATHSTDFTVIGEKSPAAPGELITLFIDTNKDIPVIYYRFDQNSQVPLSLGGVTALIGGAFSGVLYASPNQINIRVPFVAPGASYELTLKTPGANGDETYTVTIPVAPASLKLFQMLPGYDTNTIVASQFQVNKPGQLPTYTSAFTQGWNPTRGAFGWTVLPFNLDANVSANDVLSLGLYGSGFSKNPPQVVVFMTAPNGSDILVGDVLYVGPQNAYPGLDQINVRLDVAKIKANSRLGIPLKLRVFSLNSGQMEFYVQFQ